MVGGGIGWGENVGLDAAGDLEFLLELAELLVAMDAASGGDVAEGGEEDGEAHGFDVDEVAEGLKDVVR